MPVDSSKTPQRLSNLSQRIQHYLSSPSKLYLFYLENLLTPKLQLTSCNWFFFQKQTT